jgi:methylmalonyl-CoA mutase C-terminal domain/subunit
MKKRKLTDTLLIGGGIIPPEDAAALRKKGVAAIFTPGATTREIVKIIQERTGAKKRAAKRTKNRMTSTS